MLRGVIKFFVVVDFSTFFLFEMVPCKGVLLTVCRGMLAQSPVLGVTRSGLLSLVAAVQLSARGKEITQRGYRKSLNDPVYHLFS